MVKNGYREASTIINKMALVTIALTYFLIVFGGFVASTESGMGCGPEWPLCNGEVIPVLKGDTLIEFAHRVIGATLFIFSLVLFFMILRRHVSGSLRKAAYIMITILITEIIFGAFVVWYDLPPVIVTAHLLTSMLFIATLIWIWRMSNPSRVISNIDTPKSLMMHVHAIIALLVVTLGLGAYIKHAEMGLACGWLGCGETVLPRSLPQLIQSLHRYIAVVASLYILFLTFHAYRMKWNARIQARLLVASVIVLMQVTIGIITILTGITVLWAVLHLAMGMATAILIFELRANLTPPMRPTHHASA